MNRLTIAAAGIEQLQGSDDEIHIEDDGTVVIERYGECVAVFTEDQWATLAAFVQAEQSHGLLRRALGASR
jgi:hypothetical protein